MYNSIFLSFFHWFFAVAPADILRLARNFLQWNWHFFSIGYFVPRLFAPWHRDLTPYGRGFDLKRFLHIFGWNLISRVIGAVLRIAIMIFGLATELLLVIVIVIVFLVWFFLPAAGLFLIGLGIFTLVVS